MARRPDRVEDLLAPANYDPKSTYSKLDMTAERIVSVTGPKGNILGLKGKKNKASFLPKTPPLKKEEVDNEKIRLGTENNHTSQEPDGGPFGGPLKP